MPESCPICGTTLEDGAAAEYSYRGTVFRFCSVECLHMFRQYPEDFAAPENGDEVVAVDDSETLEVR